MDLWTINNQIFGIISFSGTDEMQTNLYTIYNVVRREGFMHKNQLNYSFLFAAARVSFVSSSVLLKVNSTSGMDRLKSCVVKKCVHCPRPSRCYAQQA